MKDNELFIETEMNNTFSLDAVEKTLNELKNTSFNYLEDLQYGILGYKRFDFKMGEFEFVTSVGKINYTIPRKFVVNVKGNLISEKNRISYKKSSLFNKELSSEDIAQHPELFEYNVIVFVNGMIFTGFKVFCKEEDTFIIVNTNDSNTLSKKEMETYISNDYDVTVLFIPNNTIGVSDTNGNVLKLNASNYALSRFSLVNVNEKADFIGGVSLLDSKCMFKPLSMETFNDHISMDYDFAEYENKYASLSIFGMKYLYRRIILEPGTTLFDLPLTKMPISPKNLLFFKLEDGTETFIHNIDHQTYFPNVCELKNTDPLDTIVVYVFYYDSISNILEYDNELKDYISKYQSLIPLYSNQIFGQMLLDYKPMDLLYGIHDYNLSPYYPDDFKYKVEKMREVISKYPIAFKKYIENQIEKYHSYYMDMSKIDLSEKLRNNNKSEILNVVHQEDFSESRYVFVFKNKDHLSNDRIRFFIDGILYVPDKIFNENGYDFYYIQESLITPTSIIEIEIFDSINLYWEKTFTYPNDNLLISNISGKKILASHLYLTDLDKNEYLDSSKFKIFYYAGTTLVELDANSNKILPEEFYVKLTDDKLLNVPIRISATKYFFYNTKKADMTGSIIQFDFDTTSKFNSKNIRIFKNGRILPQSVLVLSLSNKPLGKSYGAMSMISNQNDLITFDYTPYRYNTVYEAQAIQSNGFVDLRNKINKPFDLKWFDIYLNGRKLTYHHIDIITPYIIRLKNVTSLKHLYICEKDRDVEYFNPMAHIDNMAELFNLDSDYKNYVDSLEPDIIDTELDIIVASVSNIILEMAILQERYLMSLFINPDLQQATYQMKQDVPDLLLDGSNISINPDLAFK